MEQTRWNRIEALFEQAATLPAGERQALLDEACPDDPTLRAEVEALLSADTDGYLDHLGAEVFGPALDAALDGKQALTGQRIGPYQVTAWLGRGGMGTVYHAERADGAFEQAVALKVVRQGLGASSTARFLAERRILARLEHPAIARLVDGGLTPDGRPWLAMELVEGEPITTYAEREGLSLREKLFLFRRACDAVAYAHRMLIVHRDLKPPHLIVTPEGELKLLDFGVAKLLEPGDALAEALTRTSRPMTPRYAAPEQIRGDVVSAAADVYSLGVILFELLTGKPPFCLDAASRHAFERTVLEDEPPRPSRVAPPEVRRLLSGDLDAILLKALRKEPDRRYSSVEALDADLRRHLDGFPVQARADSFSYRVGKFVQRHQTAALAATLVLLTLVGGLISTRTAALRAETQAARAYNEAAKAERIADFVTGLFTAANPDVLPGEYVNAYTADDVSVQAVLERGLTQAEALGDQPAVQAELLEVIAQTLLGLGDGPTAQAAAEQTLALRRDRLLAGDPSVDRRDLASSLHTYARARFHNGDADAAVELLDEALAHLQRHGRPVPQLQGRILLTQGGALATLARNGEALQCYREALRLFEHAGTLSDQVETLYLLGALLRHEGQLEEAAEALTSGLQATRLANEPDALQVASLTGYLGIIYLEQGRLDEAEALLYEAIATLDLRLPEHHRALLRFRTHLGAVRVRQGRFAEAASILRPVHAWRYDTLGPDHIETAETAAWLGGAEAGQGHFTTGERLMLGALDTFTSFRGPRDRYVLQIHAGLAELYALWNRHDEAAVHLAALGTPPANAEPPSEVSVPGHLAQHRQERPSR